MPRQFAAIAVLLAALLSGCETVRGKRDTGYNWPYPEKPGATSPETGPGDSTHTTGLPEAESQSPPTELASIPPERLPDFPRNAEQISGPAVAGLIRQARAARAAGQPEQAQGKLERALKIEPRNYFAWSELAATYLDQKNYEQALGVAGKSNSLARGNLYVELDNYRVIQESRQALGDSDGAFQAKARADEIQQRLQQAEPARYNP